jgi:hypothetical protein
LPCLKLKDQQASFFRWVSGRCRIPLTVERGVLWRCELSKPLRALGALAVRNQVAGIHAAEFEQSGVMASKIFNRPNFAFVQTQILARAFGSVFPDRYDNRLAFL